MIRKNKEPFVYAAYSAGYTMKDESYVEKMDYSRFNFYYLMCYPKWVVSDFDNSLKDIITKYVTEFNYPNSLSGCGLSTAFIDSVHVAGAKVLLSIQGDSFIEIANDKERRNKFAIMIAQFIRKYDYDGLDLDWEGTLDLDLHYLFMKKVRQELNGDTKKNYYLTTALPSSKQYSQELADSLSQEIDWINLMTYDMGGGVWDPYATYNTPMGRIERNLKKWDVFDRSKLCIGLASYGFYYENLQPEERIPLNKKMSDYGCYISYSSFRDSINQGGWVEEWDDSQKVPYFFSSNRQNFITIDIPRSINYKMSWVENNGYRGVFWWELYHDFKVESSSDRFGKFLLKDSVQISLFLVK